MGSLFVNGERASDPQALPENLHGKTLFPTITYRNVTLQLNFGPAASLSSAKLPFTCRTVGEAATAEVEKGPTMQSGKAQVLFPVGLPDTGYFDWVDQYLAKHPELVELSDRKMQEWAHKSGLGQVNRGAKTGGSNDKP